MFKKIPLMLPLLLVFALLLCSCSGPAPESDPQSDSGAATEPAVPESSPYDASGKYLLSENGEAIMKDDKLNVADSPDDNYRVFYEIFVGSFSDSNGDGIGDLRGIINRLDYLNDGDPNSGLSLGVEGIWLTPIFPSASYHKYNTRDYYNIDSSFGTLTDFEELLAKCHSRGIKVILDLVINHSSRTCEWFSQFLVSHRQDDPTNPYYDYYSYYKQGDKAPAGRNFAQLSGTDLMYECNFDGDMPEFNYDNEAVRAQMVDVAKFWLDLGVDGFRFDAAKYIYYGDNAASAAFWEWYIGELKAIKPDIYTVAEVWDGDGVTDRYYPALNCFNFTTSQSSGLIATTAKGGDVNQYVSYVGSYLERIHALREDAMLLSFISNHDMDRAAGFLTVASGQAHMAANLYLLGPGSPFIYYGEEIGLRGSRGGANTDANRRLIMLWGDGDTVANPVGSTYSSQTDTSVKAQLADGSSLLSYYKLVLMVRKANPEIARGEYTPLACPDKASGFTATLDGKSVCVLHNTTNRAISIDLSALTELSFSEINAVLGMGDVQFDGKTVTIAGQTSVVLR